MDRRHGLAGHKAEQDAGGQVVFPDAGAELEVLLEHGWEWEGHGL